MTTEEFLQRLLDYEYRIATLYLTLGNRAHFSGDVWSFWHRMAEDERHHAVVLQRTRTLADLQESAPAGSHDVFLAIEQELTAAETALAQVHISIDEALRYAVRLEGSELNRLNESWFRCFPPALQTLLSALTREDNLHLRRVIEAVHAFSSNKALHEQATTLWVKSQRVKTLATPVTKHNPGAT